MLYAFRRQGPTLAVRRWSEIPSWITLVLGLVFGLGLLSHHLSGTSHYFQLGSLQGLIVPYILLMGVLIKRFAYHYLQSDQHYASFFLKIKLLVCCLLLFVVLNNAILLGLTWMAAGWIMVALISHAETSAAVNSAQLAKNRFLIGDLLLLAGIAGMIQVTGNVNISEWVTMPLSQHGNILTLISLICIVLGTCSKTAVIPFQKWLVHTMSAPTPVSAIMHAGFVNAGAILLAKVSPLLVNQPLVLILIFSIGLVSALYGSAVMLVQTDVKRYLAFSTIGQMGFMIMECGMGAFHLAILHLIIHGFFKSRLFLSAGSVIEHRQSIRNAKYRYAQTLATHETPSRKFQVGGIILITSLSAWLAVFQVPYFRSHILQISPALLAVLMLSTIFTNTALLTAIRKISIPLVFSTLLLCFYVGYEVIAQNILPNLDCIAYVQQSVDYTVSTILLFTLGMLTWLVYLKIIPISGQLSEKFYVFLFSATGPLARNSSFSHRNRSTR